MSYKCIVIDDEPLAIKALTNLIQKLKDLEIVATCSDAFEANNCLQNNKVDLMFLDIQMPELTGISFLKSLKNSPKVIFTTAYRNYAVEAFELDVIDYLVKPVSFERLLKAVNKFHQLIEKNENVEIKDQNINKRAFIYVRSDRMVHKIFLDEILYVENLREYLQIITKAKKYITKMAISNLEKELPENEFTRTHQSYIVALSKISSFNQGSIVIADKHIPISRNYKVNVLKKLDIK